MTAWFDWLQAGAPTGPVERYPALTELGESTLPGVYVTGDLTGIPLLKLAAESGHHFVERLCADAGFTARRDRKGEGEVLDLLVVGAGPSGVAAAITAADKGLSCRVLEASVPFNTIENFPKGKPIFAEPSDREGEGPLKIRTGVKEGLLSELGARLSEADIDILQGVRVHKLERRGDVVVAIVGVGNEHRALAVVLAIGKTGNPRRLGVPGEEQDHVFGRLFDPAAHKDEDVVVVGGGDSAVEAAVALAEAGNRVVLSYRKAELTRPKEGNLRVLGELVDAGRITLRLGTELTSIGKDQVRIAGVGGEGEQPATAVYGLIGTEMPNAFFKRSGIRLEGERTRTGKLLFLLSILFASLLYFGKSAGATLIVDAPVGSWGEALSALFSGATISALLRLPSVWLSADWGAWTWKGHLLGLLAWTSLMAMFPVLGLLAVSSARTLNLRALGTWQRFKAFYFTAAFTFFCVVFFGSRYLGLELGGKSPSFWYGVAYCVTMTIFGARRMRVRPTPYIRVQTVTLVAIQWVFLWLLPEVLFPWLGANGHLGGPEGFWMTQVFPGGAYWRAYGFALAWPLFIYNVATANPTGFWLVVSVVQTFLLIPLGIRYFGKGFYCGWICPCGGLAETLGDEYRTLAPHGPKAKRWENAGQIVLAVVTVMTLLKLANGFGWVETSIPDHMGQGYTLIVDIIFGGVLGVGVYFFMSGRVWCRFLCPLAALMHIYTKFTRYRIFSRKTRCISCNICTKSCHMGIDVMSYAVRGRPMDDVECVRCSACVVNCPMDVLAFGRLDASGSMIPPKLHATLFPPVDWQAAAAGPGGEPCASDTFIFDPVKKIREAEPPARS